MAVTKGTSLVEMFQRVVLQLIAATVLFTTAISAEREKMSAQTTTIRIPSDLYKRVKRLAARVNKTMSTIFADGARTECTIIEQQLRAEEGDKERAEREARERRRRTIRGEIRGETSPDTAANPASDSTPVEPSPVDEQEDALYLRHAKKIVAAIDNPDPAERRLAAHEAIRAICAARPLTSDPIAVENELHRRVNALMSPPRPQQPAPPSPPKKEGEQPSFFEKFLRFAHPDDNGEESK